MAELQYNIIIIIIIVVVVVVVVVYCNWVFTRWQWHDFRKKKQLLNTKCVFRVSLQLLSETFLIIRRTEQDRLKTYNGLQVKYPTVILVRFKWNSNFLDRLSKNTQVPNFIKISLVGAELFHTDRQTYMMKLRVVFAILRKCLKRAHSAAKKLHP